jgi:hypothetical protein
MKLESLKSSKFKTLNSTQLSKLNGGNAFLAADSGLSGVSVTWTKSKQVVDDSCSDCD